MGRSVPIDVDGPDAPRYFVFYSFPHPSPEGDYMFQLAPIPLFFYRYDFSPKV